MRDKVLNFFREIRGEFNRISWPGRVEIIGLTTLVIIIVVVLSLYIGILDLAFKAILQQLLRR